MLNIKHKKSLIPITKRHKFVIGVILSSLILFIAEYSLGKSGIVLIFFLSILSDLLLFWALREDLKDNFYPQIFILPFVYTFSFGLWFFLFPHRLIIRIFLTVFYMIGLYSLYLSQNIFIVSSIRTIALLSSARTVSLLLTVISYCFAMTVIFSISETLNIAPHLNALFTFPTIFLFTVLFSVHSIWTFSLEKAILPNRSWYLMMAVCVTEVAILLWLWPSTPFFIALFLTGFLYILLGLTHVWFEKRLFRGVIQEYVWVAIFVFIFLVAFTTWS